MRSIVSVVSWAFDSVASREEPVRLADLLGPQASCLSSRSMTMHEPSPWRACSSTAGLPVMELALRTPGAMSALRAVRSTVQDAVVGVGTVLSSEHLFTAVTAGAAFAVSPGSSDELLAAAPGCPVPYVPGVATATELMRVVEAGIREVKFFPAETLGGASAVAALSALASSVRFLPTGGIDAGSAPAYLVLGAVFAVGGSWICPRDRIRAGSWDVIGRLALAASRFSRSDPA